MFDLYTRRPPRRSLSGSRREFGTTSRDRLVISRLRRLIPRQMTLFLLLEKLHSENEPGALELANISLAMLLTTLNAYIQKAYYIIPPSVAPPPMVKLSIGTIPNSECYKLTGFRSSLNF